MDSMRAVTRDRHGPPEALELAGIRKLTPGPGEVLVRVGATGLNASDVELSTGTPLYARSLGLFTPSHRVLGSDVAGTVEAMDRRDAFRRGRRRLR